MSEEKGGISRRKLLKDASLGAASLGAGQLVRQKIGVQAAIVDKRSPWEKFLDDIITATCAAWSQWGSTSTMTGVVVNAVTATGGQIVGPPLAPLILARAPKADAVQLRRSSAFATALGNAWMAWAASVKVPGMPWYPAFAAFPSPVAPPTPNVPCPLIALLQVDTGLQPLALAAQIKSLLGDDAKTTEAEKAVKDFTEWFGHAFINYRASCMITNVLGTGPIPTFAPPYVPVGPVVGGTATMTPGGFAGAAPQASARFPSQPGTAPTEFEIGGFKLKLDAGQIVQTLDGIDLYGTVSITPITGTGIQATLSNASLTLMDSAARSLRQRQTRELSGQFTVGTMKPQPVFKFPKSLKVVAFRGGARQMVVPAGGVTIPIPSPQLQLTPDGKLGILGGEISFKGITHSIGRGSYLSPSELKLVGWIPLGTHVITDSTLLLRPNSITGAGRLQAFAHSFNLNYDLSGSALRAAAETGGPGKDWQSMPLADGIQYRADGTRLKVEINGRSLTARVRIPTLGVRSSALKPNGAPWSEGSGANLEAVVMVNGDVDLRPPGLPKPADPFQTSREACERAARESHKIPEVSSLLVGEAKRLAEEARDRAQAALNAALEECRKKNPRPPALPAPPPAFRVKVGNLVG